MSIIAVKGVPLKWSLKNVVKILSRSINGNFEPLNFLPGVKGKLTKYKICYLRLSEKLDPVRILERINSTTYPKQFRPFAFVPDHVPDIPLATKRTKPKLPAKSRQAVKQPDAEKVINMTNEEMVTELQLKYPGLYKLSMKTNHRLLEDIAKKIAERLKEISGRDSKASESCATLSAWYRRAHPHFGDIQLVLSTLHALQDAAGAPRTQLQEEELAALPPQPYMIGNVPFSKVQAACNKYSDRIIKKVSEHVKNLKSDVTPMDTEDEVVRKKVREELKKMTPFLPMIVKEVVTKHFIPRRNIRFHKARIYGEPFLPPQETMLPFMLRYQATRITHSDRMYNLVSFNVPPSHYASLMAMDGTVLNGAKLIIRSSEMPHIKVSAGEGGVTARLQLADVEEEQEEDWDQLV